MKYRVILAFETYSVGNVIEPTGLWADSLKQRGYIEPIVEPVKSISQADINSLMKTIKPRIRPKKLESQ